MNGRNLSLLVITALCSVLLAAGPLTASSSKFPGGVTIHDPEKVTPGKVIFTARDGDAYMIDLDGNVEVVWDVPELPIAYVKPLPNGKLLAALGEGVNGQDMLSIVILDKESNIVWEFLEPEGVEFHHDMQILPGGEILILCSKMIDRPEISDKTLQDDCLMVVDQEMNVLWEWQTADHFDDFGFSQQVKDGIFEKGGDWAHANAAYPIPIDTSHTDPRFAPGNIVVSYRFISNVVIVDRISGDIVWIDDNSEGQHDSKMLPDGLPGGGNILIFDNGIGDKYSRTGRGWSRIVEIDPTVEVDPTDPDPHKQHEIVWEYTAEMSGRPNWYFDSWFISGQDRMPNGNTMICEGSFGRIFEVTPEGEIVWEYVNEFADFDTGDPPTNRVYRAHKVPEGW